MLHATKNKQSQWEEIGKGCDDLHDSERVGKRAKSAS